MTYVGIDLHSNNMANVALNGNGKVVGEANLLTATRSLEDFFNGLEEPIRAVVECTSNWYWLSDWCRANGIDLTLAHAKMPGPLVTPGSKPIKWMRGPWSSACWRRMGSGRSVAGPSRTKLVIFIGSQVLSTEFSGSVTAGWQRAVRIRAANIATEERNIYGEKTICP